MQFQHLKYAKPDSQNGRPVYRYHDEHDFMRIYITSSAFGFEVSYEEVTPWVEVGIDERTDEIVGFIVWNYIDKNQRAEAQKLFPDFDFKEPEDLTDEDTQMPKNLWIESPNGEYPYYEYDKFNDSFGLILRRFDVLKVCTNSEDNLHVTTEHSSGEIVEIAVTHYSQNREKAQKQYPQFDFKKIEDILE